MKRNLSNIVSRNKVLVTCKPHYVFPPGEGTIRSDEYRKGGRVRVSVPLVVARDGEGFEARILAHKLQYFVKDLSSWLKSGSLTEEQIKLVHEFSDWDGDVSVVPDTINIEALKKLPRWGAPKNKRLVEYVYTAHQPPGWPATYIKSVVTLSGRPPRSGARLVLFGRIVEYAERPLSGQELRDLMMPLWVKPPVDSTEVSAWAYSCAQKYYRQVVHNGAMVRPDIDVIKRMLDSGELKIEQTMVADHILKYYPDFPRGKLYELATKKFF
jgi:hypothetical protein